MKLQAKISIIIIITLFLSTLVSLVFINLFVLFFDKSYSENDIEKVASYAIKQIENLNEYNIYKIKDILFESKLKFNNNFDFTYFDEERRELITSTEPMPERLNINDLKKRIEEEEKRAVNQTSKPPSEFKFIDYFRTRDFNLRRPIIFNENIRGFLVVSVKKEFLLPFYIRINSEKKIFLYAVFFVTIFLILIVSYLLVFLLTIPIIKRLKILFTKINNFELNKPNIIINDQKKDEIGIISNTFDKMANKINENYNDMRKFYKDRQELLKNISHDFRTPLTSILGYSISLDEGVYDNEKERKKYIKIIRKKALYMSDLFDEMMELTRLDNNSYVLKKITFNIAEMIREIIIEYLPQLEKEKFFIETEIPETININGDKERLSRGIRNIIDNVLKHASEGKYIGLFVRKNKNSTISIIIKDKGKGINDKDKNKIFNRFYHDSKKSGMGLGLTIAKEIIEKHKGKVKFESKINFGTSFIIELKTK